MDDSRPLGFNMADTFFFLDAAQNGEMSSGRIEIQGIVCKQVFLPDIDCVLDYIEKDCLQTVSKNQIHTQIIIIIVI